MPHLSRAALKAQHGFCDMLTPDGYNPKLKKGRARGYSSAVVHLAPANLSGREVCHHRSKGCTLACLNTAGHGGIKLDALGLNDVQRARIARTNMFFDARDQFFIELVAAIETHCRRAIKHGLIPVVRLNGTSDIDWEREAFSDNGVAYDSIFARFPNVQFYDYTKNPARAMLSALGCMPANYVLTFSRAETRANNMACQNVLNAGGNVAVVFNICDCKRACKHEIPDIGLEYFGHRVVSGDHDDLRHLDPPGVVIGLKGKGRAKQDTSGFVVDIRSELQCSRPVKPITTRARRPRATLAA
jgi:hypothetical protein